VAKIKAYIVPTTHWDREWVMHLGQYQIRLGHMLDQALDLAEKYPEYRFMLDGQAIVLSDYLQVCPENRKRLEEAMQKGSVVAGPWYVLADQALESYESTVRNLYYGMEEVRAMGGRPMMEGYVPDTFGSMAALPQVLNGFDIHMANFGRGNPGLPSTECDWRTQDGSHVACASHGYGNGLFLSYPDIWVDIFAESGRKLNLEKTLQNFMAAAQAQLEKASAPVLYFSVGLDHMEPREELLEAVEYIRTHQDQYELIYGTTQDYMEEVARYPLSPYEGEFRGTPEKKDTDLNGTLTSRMDTKIANLRCERMLQYQLEPVWAAVSHLGLGKYPQGALDRLWKAVIACHPHDSICGCSLDEVHAHMLSRLEDVRITGEYLRDEGIRLLANALGKDGPENAVPVLVFKGGGMSGSAAVQGIVRIPRRFRFDSYRLTDAQGREIPCRARWLCDKNKDLESVYMTRELISQVLSKSSPDDRADDQVFTMVELTFTAENMPAAGWQCFYLQPGVSSAAPMHAENNILRNEYTQVTLRADGTFDLTDLASGKCFPGLNRLVDRLESGDGYAHHEPEDPQEMAGRCSGWKITLADPAECRAEAEIAVGDRLQATLCVSLRQGCPEARVALHIRNLRGNHCLRALFPAEGETVACDHGVSMHRPDYRSGAWLEHPFTDYVSFGELTLFQGSLTAYEGNMVELLRCAGRLGPAAGADHPTPAGQMIGEITHEYALQPMCAQPMAASAQYHAGCVIEAGAATGHLPHENAMLSAAKAAPVVSLKKAWDGRGFIVRMFNPGEACPAQLQGSLPAAGEISVCRLDETEQMRMDAGQVELPAYGPVTIRVKT